MHICWAEFWLVPVYPRGAETKWRKIRPWQHLILVPWNSAGNCGVRALLRTCRTCSRYLWDIHSPTEPFGIYRGVKNVSFLFFIICLSPIYDPFLWTFLWSRWPNSSVLIGMWCRGWVFLPRHKCLDLELFWSFFVSRKDLLLRNTSFRMEWFSSKIIAQCSSNI